QAQGNGEQAQGNGEQVQGDGEQTQGNGEQTQGDGEQTQGDGEQARDNGKRIAARALDFPYFCVELNQMNTLGQIFRLTTFGESHGAAIGGVIDGCPAGIELDLEQIQHELGRRKPGQSRIVSQRKESDTVQFLSGIFEG